MSFQYDSPPPKISVAELDNLVSRYKNQQPDALDIILHQFHPLITKYIRLLKGDSSPALINYDTIQFLALFLPRQEKTMAAAGRVIAYLGQATAFLEEDDLYNEIVALLIECLQEFNPKQGSSLGYLITRLRWKLRNWLIWQVIRRPYDCCNDKRVERWTEDPHGIHDDLPEDLLLQADATQEESNPATRYEGLSEMDLSWVQQTDDPLFRELTIYERYLLYLYWKEELSFEEMSQVLRRDKDTIHRHYTNLMSELKEMSNFCRKCFDSPCRCASG